MTLHACLLLTLTTTLACHEEDAKGDDTGATTDGGVADGGVSDGGDSDGGTPDDTGDPGIPFEVVVETYGPYDAPCAPYTAEESHCAADDLVVLSASTTAELTDLFDEHILGSPPPKTDLDGRIALLSYLPWCPSVSLRLQVDHVALSGSTLQVDELLAIPDGKSLEDRCIYNVVTIPETDFSAIETSLTEVPLE